MALLVAAVVLLSLGVQTTPGDPQSGSEPCNSIRYERSPWSDRCSRDGCPGEDKGAAEALIEELRERLREAEEELRPRYPPHHKVRDGEEFDFIVVGAGSAGAVVAHRLSEEAEWRVLLAEAGGDPPVASEVPYLAMGLQGTEVDWQYETDEEEDNCLGMVGGRCKWPRGKLLGGSSSINYMMHTRGDAKDFDGWAEAGNTGWSYEEVLPYFIKSEDMRDPAVWATEEAGKYHGTGGPLSLESWPSDGDIHSAVGVAEDSMREVGYPYNADCNGRNLTGFTRMQGALRDHRRCSSAKAFLSSATERKNLFLSKHSLVTKILIDSKNSKAYGVRLRTNDGEIVQVRAKKEIIVSAGAINSPQLLMLSGIGPKEHLEHFKIPVVKDLPVGYNLQDHPLMMTTVQTTNLSISLSPPSLEDTFKFLLKRENLLSTLSSFPYATYVNTVPNVDYPDIEILQQHFGKNEEQNVNFLGKLFNLREDILEEIIEINKDAYTIIPLASMLRPHSRGRILLQSADPDTHPKIVSGMLSDERDVATFLRTYDFISRLTQTEAMKRVDGKLHEVRVSSCEKHQFASPEYRECAMRHLTGTTYHYCGTCRMGALGDPAAVVDPSLRVLGVLGLRVADASVMPTIVSAHINAATVMIGEKAADLVKREWGRA